MLKTFHSGFVRCDGGTLYGHTVLLGSEGGVDGDLVISLVAVRQTQVKIFQFHVDIGQDELRGTENTTQDFTSQTLNK